MIFRRVIFPLNHYYSCNLLILSKYLLYLKQIRKDIHHELYVYTSFGTAIN